MVQLWRAERTEERGRRALFAVLTCMINQVEVLHDGSLGCCGVRVTTATVCDEHFGVDTVLYSPYLLKRPLPGSLAAQ